ncbi:leucine-rich repeat-containing protein 24-like [Athalia rosae]|uniref:leucine-rich repeat-containing protein 24-like n=1 Tax=Athalia rosae TaxID=37344 RepID=UPI002033C2D3|nr:leucine-rich repeat-containing protein 24-like [Athalia rosae]
MCVTHAHPLRGRILLALFILIASFTLLSSAVAFPDWTDCPAVCRCKWTSGKKSALCPDAGLTTLPASLDPDMQVLDLSGNKILSLHADMFNRAGLLNLQRVFLRNAGISKIDKDAFRDLGILVEVDLSDNLIETLHPDTFLGNERLRILILSGNKLVKLTGPQFPDLPHLRNLELQRCSLNEIHNQAFARVTGLETLRLEGNHLEYVEALTFLPLIHLKTLSLDGNPWSCDCRLRKMRSWITPNRLYSAPQKCESPSRLEGRRWEDVKPQEFACGPEALVTANSFQEEMSGNLSLACMVTGDPEPEVWWQFNGSPLNVTRGDQVFVTEETYNGFRKWNNVTLYNASDSDAGEYSCVASNVAGVAKDAISIVIPRVYTAPTLSQTDTWLLWVSLAGGGAAALCASLLAVLLAVCLCGSRQKSKRKKVKLQGSASFGDQEKKLLDLSLTTTTNERISGRASLEAVSSPGDLELAERSSSLCDPPVNVTIERHCRDIHSQLPQVFPPPPEFTTSILPAGVFGNIFISVSLAQDGERRYPDLLDIPVHASISDKSSGPPPPIPTTSILSGFATLPRRPLRVSDLSSPYDNMGPRVTATGSSTFSLTDPDLRLSPPPPSLLIQPPIEFVSL